MSHIFDPKTFKRLDSPKRKNAMPTEVVCTKLALTSDMIIADVGCGVGYFAFPFSEVADTVHAFDISPIMIEELDRRITSQTNIKTHLGDFNELIDSDILDLFFTANVIHELNDLAGFTQKAITKLKIGGRLAYLDFHKVEADFGPSYEKRIAAEFVVKLFKQHGLHDIEHHNIKENFYIIVGKK